LTIDPPKTPKRKTVFDELSKFIKYHEKTKEIQTGNDETVPQLLIETGCMVISHEDEKHKVLCNKC
jgi:hypothetical protein